MRRTESCPCARVQTPGLPPARQALAAAPLRGLAFAPSFGASMLVVGVLLSPPLFVLLHRRPPNPIDLGDRRDVLAGLASGFFWGLAYVGVDGALGAGVSQALTASAFQCALLVAGLWGVAFAELVGATPIGLY